MPLNHFVTLGRSGLRVSPLCLGTLTFGIESGYGVSPEESARLLDAYLDRGGNFVDTANFYSYGHAEKIIGDAFAAAPGKRARTVLATKFGTATRPGDPNSGGANRAAIISACEHSLRRLRTDYIDLYWQHYADPFTPVEETMRALDDLVRAGKIRYAGISDNQAWRIAQAHVTAELRSWTSFAAIQTEYSLAERGAEAEHLPMAEALGLGVTPFALLADGVLSGKHLVQRDADSPQVRADIAAHRMKDRVVGIVEALRTVAERHGASLARIAVAWVASRPGISSPIIGARTLAQLEDNLCALDLELSAEDLAALDEVSRPRRTYASAMLDNTLPLAFPDVTINAREIKRNHFSPKPDQDYY